MQRPPGMQNQYRLEEIAKALARAASSAREAERQIAACRVTIHDQQTLAYNANAKVDALLSLQKQLIETQQWTELGLPLTISGAEFEHVTGIAITS